MCFAAIRHEHLVNGYGPTETTTFAITHEIREVPEGARSIPLGRPISNTQIYILDANREPAPIGVTRRDLHRRSGSGAGLSEPPGADGGGLPTRSFQPAAWGAYI